MDLHEAEIRGAMSGDSASYARLVEAYATTISSVAYAIVRDIAASEDVAQETFLAAWRDLTKLRNPSSFLPWLRQITRNQAKSWLREHRREVSDAHVLSLALDPRPHQEDVLIDNEQRRIVNDVLDALPEQTREVLVLYYREGSSVAHVADLLGISDDAVKQRLARARATLREETLRRFGATMSRTAPAATFVTLVAGALTTAAPPASAAVSAAAATNTAATVITAGAKGTSLGALAALAGVWMGMKHLEPYFDDREEAELRRFSVTTAIVVLLFCAAFGGLPSLHSSRVWGVVLLFAFFASVIYLCWIRLPRILARRLAWEREIDPAMAALHRRKQVWMAVSQTLGAIIGGGSVMVILLRNFL